MLKFILKLKREYSMNYFATLANLFLYSFPKYITHINNKTLCIQLLNFSPLTNLNISLFKVTGGRPKYTVKQIQNGIPYFHGIDSNPPYQS